uniref:Secreted protein n=1 Tax=Ascaris lumbricoides TaxID=6252 RepID=A0A0M3ICQ8_ASCLU
MAKPCSCFICILSCAAAAPSDTEIKGKKGECDEKYHQITAEACMFNHSQTLLARMNAMNLAATCEFRTVKTLTIKSFQESY